METYLFAYKQYVKTNNETILQYLKSQPALGFCDANQEWYENFKTFKIKYLQVEI